MSQLLLLLLLRLLLLLLRLLRLLLLRLLRPPVLLLLRRLRLRRDPSAPPSLFRLGEQRRFRIRRRRGPRRARQIAICQMRIWQMHICASRDCI